MKKYQTSIFNDVLGPVMTGPSSSHTAGPGRIGLFIGALIDGTSEIAIEFPKSGSYAGTYRGQKSDVAFVAGVLGMGLTDNDFKNSLSLADKRGVSVKIKMTGNKPKHPNECVITVGNGDKKISVESRSTGGGMFEIRAINGSPVVCAGDCHELIIFEKPDDARLFEYIFSDAEKNLLSQDEIAPPMNGVANVKLKEAPQEFFLDEIKKAARESGGDVKYIPPIIPVARRGDIELPFTSAMELQSYIDQHPMPLWKAAVFYESARSGWSEEKILRIAAELAEVMLRSIKSGLESDFEISGFLTPKAKMIDRYIRNGRIADAGVINDAALYSVSVMEYNNSMGIVVASPTAGSCGVVPGVLFAIAGIDKPDITECAKALLCAGLIGVFISNGATFAAEVCGCQAETGAAAAMASAVASYFIGGDIETTLNGASAALQNSLGLICDPVAGYTDIPCISRNAAAAANAIVSANLAACGFDSVIPFDEVVGAIHDVGKMLPPELRCTGRGGLCATETGKRIAKSRSSEMY